MKARIDKTNRGRPTLEGAGVHLHRVFGYDDLPDFDPFLLFDDFRSDVPGHYEKGFPWHPHRGIETITYVLAGEVEHGDSMGNSGVIGPGDVQWMTAGNGIIHQEMPKGDAEGRMYGFQLWANLPAKVKMTDPRYQDIASADIPVVTPSDAAEVRVICGDYEGVSGPVDGVAIQPVYYDVTLKPASGLTLPIAEDHMAVCYVFQGDGTINGTKGENRICLLVKEESAFEIHSGEKGLRFLFISGKPVREPVAWGGPIVMNTREELQAAFEEYNNGTFLQH